MHTLVSLASLPTCLAYVSIVVLMVYSSSVFANIKVLAPYGRMALTNYLMQSFYSNELLLWLGFGHFGMGRASQLAFAIGVIVLQVVFSHLWLRNFKAWSYGMDLARDYLLADSKFVEKRMGKTT